MKVEINGEAAELQEGATVGDAAATLGVEPGRGVAIALDGEVVPRGQLDDTVVREGQRLEIVAAIGGG